jgi:hypothetical protein
MKIFKKLTICLTLGALTASFESYGYNQEDDSIEYGIYDGNPSSDDNYKFAKEEEEDDLLEYGIYYANPWSDDNYKFAKDVGASVIHIKDFMMTPYYILNSLYINQIYNLTSFTRFATHPSILLLLGSYYYYKLNQDYKAQQEMIKQLEQKLEEQDQAASNDSEQPTEDQADDAQDNA